MLGSSSTVIKMSGLGIAALLLVAHSARAEDVTETQILRALTPVKTRSLSLGTPAQPEVAGPDQAFLDSLRNKNTHSLSVSEREKLEQVAEDKLQIDLVMEFDLNSDELRGKALATAKELGKALTNPALKGQTFMIAGHTDAKGTDAANQKLSERRADAVKRFLVQNYQIPATNLIGVGYGESHLKNTADPDASENRRVQAVNMTQVKTAGR